MNGFGISRAHDQLLYRSTLLRRVQRRLLWWAQLPAMRRQGMEVGARKAGVTGGVTPENKLWPAERKRKEN